MPARHGPRTPHDGPCERPSWAASTAYSLGCRCPRCLEWHRDYSAKRRIPGHLRRDRVPDPIALAAGCKEPRRTRFSAYKNHGCRCSACVEAVRAYGIVPRAPRAKVEPPAPQQLRDRFAERLAYALRRRGMTTSTLAKTIGLRHRTVLRWAVGMSSPQRRLWGPLCKALGIKPGFLVAVPATTSPSTASAATAAGA